MNSNESALRKMAGAAVLLVAAIAATVSYLHIYELALQLGQPVLAAYLMPISVDGAVGAASIALLAAARSGDRSPAMARLMLALGIAGTLAANAYSGSAHGIAGVVMAAWPALAFCGSAETALAMVRRSARPNLAIVADVESVSVADMTAVGKPAIVTAWPRAAVTAHADMGPAVDRPTKRTVRPAKGNRRAAAIVARNPEISGAELGRKLGLSERSGRRILAEVSAA